MNMTKSGGGASMAKCDLCEGWGFERDPKSPNGWASDGNGNGIICRKEKGGCGGSGVKPGTAKDEAEVADPATLPEQRGAGAPPHPFEGG